jgi:hypothetical protein
MYLCFYNRKCSLQRTFSAVSGARVEFMNATQAVSLLMSSHSPIVVCTKFGQHLPSEVAPHAPQVGFLLHHHVLNTFEFHVKFHLISVVKKCLLSSQVFAVCLLFCHVRPHHPRPALVSPTLPLPTSIVRIEHPICQAGGAAAIRSDSPRYAHMHALVF